MIRGGGVLRCRRRRTRAAVLAVLWFSLSASIASAADVRSSSSSSSQFTTHRSRPGTVERDPAIDDDEEVVVSLEHGPAKVWGRRWQKAQSLALLEQSVEDYNADYVARQSSMSQACQHRRLICLPLDERFDPPPGVFSHQHVQTGDKLSLPANFWHAIELNKPEVPWLFAVKRVDGVTRERVQYKKQQPQKEGSADGDAESTITELRPSAELDAIVGGPLDFRAPANYVFVPHYVMRALGLRPFDVVSVELMEAVPAGSLAKLRPHSSDFGRDISNPQAVLETELRHYSSLTAGTVVGMDYNQKRYWFDVVELRSAPRGEKVPWIKMQDCDVATDFLISRQEQLERQQKRKDQQRQKQQQLQMDKE